MPRPFFSAVSSLWREIRHSRFYWGVGLFILGFFAYSQTFGHSFHLDDWPMIVNNTQLHDFPNYLHLLIDQFPYPRGFSMLTFALNYAVHGADLYGYHLVNFAIHAVNALLVWRLSVLLFQTPGLQKSQPKNVELFSWVVAAIFLLHPLQTQAVTYIIQRMASLAALWYVLATFAYLKARLDILSEKKMTGIGWGTFAITSFLLSFFSKESAITWPVIVLLIELICFNSQKWLFRPRSLLILGTSVVVGLVLLLQLFDPSFVFGSKQTQQGEVITWQIYAQTQPSVWLKYLQLLLVPVGQNMDHDFPRVTTFVSWQFWLPLSVLIGVTLFIIKKFLRTQPIVVFGWSWIWLSMLVESSIIPIEDVLFEHRLYLPLFGFALMMTTGWWWVLQKKKSVGQFLLIGYLGLLLLLTMLRNQVWASDLTLWQDVVAKAPDNVRGHNNLGVEYQRSDNLDKASYHLRRATELNPTFPLAYHNLGFTLARQEKLEESKEMFWKAIELDPTYAGSYNDVAIIYFRQGKKAEAIEMLIKATQADPNYSLAQENLRKIEAGETGLDSAEQ